MTPELKSHMEDIRLGRKKKKNYNKIYASLWAYFTK